MSDSVTKSGIRTRTYKSQAIVYFEGDKSDNIFILKKGKVILTYFKPESSEEIKEEVKTGEFFGVKSALGRYPREETAQTIGETVILILTLDDFERLVLANVDVVKKMLRVFSNQLRRIGRAVREVMGETNAVDPAHELFKIADHYARNSRYEPALYAFKRYMEYYPDGKNASQAMKAIRSIESGNYTSSGKELEQSAPETETADFDEDFTEPADDFGMDFDDAPDSDEPLSDFGFDYDTTDDTTELSSEMDTYLNGDSGTESLDDFGLDDEYEENPRDRLKRACGLAEAGDHAGAVSILNALKGDMTVDEEIRHRAAIELGRSKKSQNKLQEALSELSLFVKNNPKSDFVKEALYEAGDVYLQSGNIDKGKAYLKKVAAMQPRTEINQKALALLKQHTFE
ncbi:MAG: cyclic nucleotide-binding domain-containing protein [Spirochaetota bacterium]